MPLRGIPFLVALGGFIFPEQSVVSETGKVVSQMR